MKKPKPIILYIIFTIAVYLLGFIIVLLADATATSGGMFPGLEEVLKAFFLLLIVIPIFLFCGGIVLLKNTCKKEKFKKSIIYLLIITLLISLITIQHSLLSVFFIVPISVTITYFIINKDNKKNTITTFIILIVLLILSLLLTASYYFSTLQEKNNVDRDYTCIAYLYSNDDYFYCQAANGIKRVDKNNSKEKKYKDAEALFYETYSPKIDFINNNNNNYLYYTIYINKYNSLESDYELHVIDTSNGEDTIIKYLKKEVILSAITDDKGNLYFETSDYDSNQKSYYYQPSKKKLLEIKDNIEIGDFYYLKNNIIYYSRNDSNTKYFKSYNLINKKKTNNGTMDNNQDIIMNSTFITINNYRYQIFNKQIYKYDISDYSKKEVIDTNQSERINSIIFDNNKLYLLSVNYKRNFLIAYLDINTNVVNNLNIDLLDLNNNYLLKNASIYHINKDDNNYIYKYDLSNKKDELFIETNVKEILNIDSTHIYLIDNQGFKAIDLKTKEISFIDKNRT